MRACCERQFEFLVAGAAILHVALFQVLLPGLQPMRLSARLGSTTAQLLKPGERFLDCKVDEESVGYYLPRTPQLFDLSEDVVASLGSEPGSALLIAPADCGV